LLFWNIFDSLDLNWWYWKQWVFQQLTKTFTEWDLYKH
jgi:hypothetical protein